MTAAARSQCCKGGMLMADGSAGAGAIRRLVDTAWSADVASADPDDPLVQGFAEFGLPPDSPLVYQLRDLEAWRDNLQIPANSALLDGTLLLTVEALLGPSVLEALAAITPVTLWELTAFIDALVCFDHLYCISNPIIDVSHFNQRLGADVLTAIPDPDGGMLRRLAAQAAERGLSEMSSLCKRARLMEVRDTDDAWDQEVRAVVDGWRAVLGPDIPDVGPFETNGIDIRLADQRERHARAADYRRFADRREHDARAADYSLYPRQYDPQSDLSALHIDGARASTKSDRITCRYEQLRILIEATRLPFTPGDSTDRPSLWKRQRCAAFATYRTYVNQGIANALALPYLPGTLRMPFRRLFVERAGEVQDELVTVALADQVFARQQPSSPLILPFFTTSVLQRATCRKDIWAQIARVRDQSVAFRRVRAELDQMLERSQVSAEALRVQSAIRDEALKLADLAGASQQTASVALGVVAQTNIVPLAGALKTAVDAAQGLNRGGSWTRIWRRLFHRHEYFLAQTNSQAIALTNALPQIQKLWRMPKIGGYLDQFASTTQQIGHMLRD